MSDVDIQTKKKPDKVNTILISIVVIALIAGIAVGFVTCLFAGSSGTTTTYNPIPVTYPKVVYEITGSAWSASVTLNNATGGTEQYNNVSLPKKYIYNSFSDNFLYISAQNEGQSGWIRVSIYVDDTLYKTATSSGAYVIATASGRRP